MSNIKYRKGAGIVIVNDAGKVFACQRSDSKGQWQLPQGGIDEGEQPFTAAKRELFEETAIDLSQVEFITETKGWTFYDWPKEYQNLTKEGYIGQTHKWFLFKFIGDDSNIDISKAADNEFSSWKWIDAKELINITIKFRKAGYLLVFTEFNLI